MSLTSFRRRGLRANLIFWFSTLLVLLFVATGLALVSVISGTLRDSLDRRATSILGMLQSRSELVLLRSDREGAAAIVAEVLEDPDVAYVAILGPKGERVLAARASADWKDQLSTVLGDRRRDLGHLVYEDENFMHFGVQVKSHHLAEGSTAGVDTGEDLLLGDPLGDEEAGFAAETGARVVEESLGFVVLGLSRDSLSHSLWRVFEVMGGLLLAGIAIFLLAAFAITRIFILAPIGVMKRAATRMTEFDLTGRTERMADDELGELSDALNGIAENLHGVLGRVQGVTDSLTTVAERVSRTSQVVAQTSGTTAASVEQTSSSMAEMLMSLKGIAGNVETLAQSAEESSSSILQMAATNDEVTSNIGSLAGSVEETTTSIEQMTYSIKEVARNVEDLSATAEETSSAMNEMDVSISQVETNANETAKLSERVSIEARSAGEALGNTVAGIDNIRESSRVAADVIEALGEKITRIGSILEVIDEVADQTNLLALNAAIIAAQAGEHGKGFAVVADEIKDLAERTGSSTKEIAELIASVQDESKNAIGAMERGVKRVDEGVRLAGEADVALRQIVDSADRSTQMVRAIARATVEQSRGSKQVAGAISRIAETVQEIARATSEQARGSEQIMRSAERMKIITKHVERSSQEQARGSKQITQAIESISEMVQRLNSAQKEQTRGAEQVVLAVEDIKDATDRQGSAVKDLELSVDTLSEQAEVLRTEVQRFRT